MKGVMAKHMPAVAALPLIRARSSLRPRPIQASRPIAPKLTCQRVAAWQHPAHNHPCSSYSTSLYKYSCSAPASVSLRGSTQGTCFMARAFFTPFMYPKKAATARPGLAPASCWVGLVQQRWQPG